MRPQEPQQGQTPRFNETIASAQAKAAFLLAMRARGIQDVNVLRALEMVPREIFVPYRYADLARRNLALPLRCGQTLPEPWLAARMIEVLAPLPHHRVLEIGAGSGYATALLARIAREVISIERFQSLAIEAGERLARLGVTNAGVAWADGLAVSPQAGPFDRVIVQGALIEIPENLIAVLAPDGVIVMARPDPDVRALQHIVRITRDAANESEARLICPCRLQAILPGVSRAL
jgi:protein-L-isoaspartate(D-aspartate) O-methyltransferase